MAFGIVVVFDNYFYLNIQILKLTSYLKTDLFHTTGSKGIKKFKKTNLSYKKFLPVDVYSNYNGRRSLPVSLAYVYIETTEEIFPMLEHHLIYSFLF